jgi:hypothetical protein
LKHETLPRKLKKVAVALAVEKYLCAGVEVAKRCGVASRQMCPLSQPQAVQTKSLPASEER